MTGEPPAPRHLHPATLVARWLKIVPQMLFGGIAAGAGMMREGLGAMLLVIAIAALVGFGVALLVWWRFTYTLAAGEIVIEKGVIARQRRVIPFDRVQDIAIEQRPLARLFGTAKVKIETGGSAADEGSLDMVALDDARALRDHIRRGRAAAVDPSEAVAEEPPEPELFVMGIGRLLHAGLFNFSLVFLAAIFAALQYLDQFDLVDWEQVVTRGNANEAAGFFSVQATLVVLGVVLLLGVVAGVVRTVARDFGYRLTRAEAGLRRRRGLLTLSEVVIPLRRTQAALIESGPIARRLGWFSLSFQTLGADRKEGGVQVAAPFARIEELLPILAEAGFPAPPPRETFHGIPRRALARRAGPWLVLSLIALAVALTFAPFAGAAAMALFLLAFFTMLAWRSHAYRVGDSALFVSRGLLKRRLWIIPFERTQLIQTASGPVQRSLALSSLLVDTAGASPLRPAEIVDLDRGEAEILADRLLALYRDARGAVRVRAA